MKRLLPLLFLVLMLNGCASDTAMEDALAFRSRCLGAGEIRFDVDICANYIDTVEKFDLRCTVDSAGALTFAVTEPEEISGISGSVSGSGGALTFDDVILAFPMMAGERLSPVSAPWVMMQALRCGCMVSCCYEEDVLHITVDDSYEEDALTVDIWAKDGVVFAAEISWDGIRQVSMTVGDFVIG